MSNTERLQNILAGASELAPEHREAFLDAACRGDATLRAEVESLLKSHDHAGQFLAAPTTDVPAARSPVSAETRHPDGDPFAFAAPLREGPGTRIGPYKLLQQIGEGGFGSVFMAEQEKPVTRKVALKIIKLGMDTRQVVARFEQERQALAMMDHANIARVFDAGATESGRPFFVMELVKGDPIVEYCDKNNLSIPERLELFAQVCQAVQHAHTKGIIHRDIKPSNILVSTQDGRPHTKVIDFGIAKATSSKLTEMTLFTEHKQLIGTPEYMSPEQAEGNLDIDTRTDVYSLGVLLYELLTGTTPFSARELRSAAYAEIQRIIREVEPPRPSTRLSSNTETIASVAANRRTEPRRLGTLVRGELDWIVMKALEKDRQRRYETANGLMLDVRRYLASEAVTAAPPSTVYRLRKFVRRNRVMVTTGSAVALALLLGLAGTAWQAKRASVQRDDAILAREGEKQQRLAAEVERNKAEKIAEFMSDTLKGVAPSVAKGRDITMLKEMMDAAATRIEKGELKLAPDAELRLRDTIGYTYRQLAVYDAAQRMLEPAVKLARETHPGDDPDTAEALNKLANLYQERGDLDKAEPLFLESIEMRKRLHPGDHPDVANGLNDFGLFVSKQGDLKRAESLLRDAVEMNKRLFKGDHGDTASALSNLAEVRFDLGDLPDAEKLFREALEMEQRLSTGDDPDVALLLNNLSLTLQMRGDLAAAEPLCRKALAMRKRIYPGDHPEVAQSLNNLAYLLNGRSDYANAEANYREALEMRKRLYPGDHPEVALALGNLAQVRQIRGDLDGAETLIRESLEMKRRLYKGDHQSIGISINNLAFLLQAKGNLAEAETLLREALAMRKRLFPGDHRDVALSLNNLANLLSSRNQPAEAEALFREALQMRKRLYPRDHTDVAASLNNVGTMLQERDDLAGAELLYREATDMWRRLSPGGSSELAMGVTNVAVVLRARGDQAGAEPLLREAFELRQRIFGEDHKLTLGSLYRLADVELANGKHAEAAPLVQTCIERNAKRFGPTHKETRNAIELAAKLYESWDNVERGKGHDVKCAQWKSKLDQLKAATQPATTQSK